MDIQVASNFERWLYYHFDENPAQVRATMDELKQTGATRVPQFDSHVFSSSRSSDADITATIQRVYGRYHYVLDPHTACGFQEINRDRTSVVLATAHPAKFPEALRAAIDHEPTHPTLEALKAKPLTKHAMPVDLAQLKDFIRAHGV
jgi:threonine synthase